MGTPDYASEVRQAFKIRGQVLPRPEGHHPPGSFELATSLLALLPELDTFCSRYSAHTVAPGFHDNAAEVAGQLRRVVAWLDVLADRLEMQEG